jgi:hypothetical protein
MSAEETELARRFVACKGWVWLPGMKAIQPADPRCVESVRLTYCIIGRKFMTDRRLNDGAQWVFGGLYECLGDWPWLPDLSDALTRAGLLPVVRQALGVPNLTPIIGADGWYLHGIPDDRPELWWSSGQPSELHALLAALEAAP